MLFSGKRGNLCVNEFKVLHSIKCALEKKILEGRSRRLVSTKKKAIALT